jgi:hypothetical protein
MTPETRAAITSIAEKAGIAPRGLLALALVKSGGVTHWTVNGERLPPIRPEPHVFHRLLDGPERERAVQLGLAQADWRGPLRVPGSHAGRYDWLHRMRELDEGAADGATSWGWGQVMGHHAHALGYGSVMDLSGSAETVEGQTEMVVRYLRLHGLEPYLAALPDRRAAERFAAACNGPGHARNDYAGKLIDAWKRLGEGRLDTPGRSVRAMQQALAKAGHYTDRVDGLDGPRTRAAVRAFQGARRIAADGIAGPMTWAEIAAERAERAERVKTRRTRQVAVAGTAGTVAAPALAEIADQAGALAVAAQSTAGALGATGSLLMLMGAAAAGYIVWRAVR